MDTSAYEAYEKQEGDFVEGAEAVADPEQPVPAEGESRILIDARARTRAVSRIQQ